MTARWVPVADFGTKSKSVLTSMGLLEVNWGICENPLALNFSRIVSKTWVKLRSSSGTVSSLYKMFRRVEVQAPPARPAGSGKEKELTLETSAEVWWSSQPEI